MVFRSLFALAALCALLGLCSCGGGDSSSPPPPPAALAVTPAGTLPQARQDWPFHVAFQATGGLAPYAYALDAGSLPAGLALAADGVLQGTPTGPGQATFTLLVRDSAGPPLEKRVPCTLEVGSPWSTARPGLARNTFFLHHSVGHNLYYRLGANGLAAKLMLDNFTTWNVAANKPLDMTYGQGNVGGYVIGDRTDPDDFPVNFNTPAYFQEMYTWNLPSGQNHQVMMFKSCYPASAISSEQMLADYRQWYESLLPTFGQYPDTLFVPFSTPPLNPVATNAAEGARARRFAEWLKYEYAANLPNLVAFDFFDVLANGPSHPTEPNMLQAAYRSGSDSHPTAAGDQAVIDRFIPFINAAVRAAGMEP